MEVSLAAGARTLSRGLRESDPKVAALGAALLALAYLRRQERPDSLVHVARLRPGQSIRVEVTDGARVARANPRRSSARGS